MILIEKGSSILVNVSVGSEIQVIASMLACVMFKDVAMIRSYYVPYYVLLKNITAAIKQYFPKNQ
jgi:hypothetical protein